MSALDTILEVLRSARFRWTNEEDVQIGIAELLNGVGVEFKREARLGVRDRIDFLAAEGVGIEVKVAGTVSDLGMQALRYVAHERVKALVVVTTRARHTFLPPTLQGKPVHVVHLYSSAF